MARIRLRHNLADRGRRLARAGYQTLLTSYFVKFAIVGTGGFTVDESLLALLHFGAGLDRYTARVLSIACAATFTWWGNRRLTFKGHAAEGGFGVLLQEWARFIAANAVGAVANYGIYLVLVTWGSGYVHNPLVATVAGVAVGLVFNFTLSKHLVFKAKKPSASQVDVQGPA